MIIIPSKIFDQMSPKPLTMPRNESEESSEGIIDILKEMDIDELNSWLKTNSVFVGKGSSRAAYILKDMTVLKVAMNKQGRLQNHQEYENTIKGNKDNAFPCFSEIYEVDGSEWRFLRVEMAKEATKKDFPKYLPYVSDAAEAIAIPLAMYMFKGNFSDLTEDDLKALTVNLGSEKYIFDGENLEDFVYSPRFMEICYKIKKGKLSPGSETNIGAIYNFFQTYGVEKMLPADLTSSENWGVVWRNKIPQLIIIDSGFSEDIRYYYT